jgi:hypothetical protein
MKRILFFVLIITCRFPVFSQKSNVALLFHTNNHEDFAFLDKQTSMIKDDLLYIYGFRTSPYKNFSKLNFINSVTNECSVDTTQLLVYVAGVTLKDAEGNPHIMLAESDSTDFENMLSYSELYMAFENCKVKNLLVVLDVANAGENMKGMWNELSLQEPYQPDSTITNEAFIAKKMEKRSRAFIASSGLTLDPTGRYTPFSSKLMEAMRNYGGNDGILNIYELKGYMDNLVDVPVMGALPGNEIGGDFLMISH